MYSITGIVLDVHDHVTQIGIDFEQDGGIGRCLVADKANSLTIASINGALAHGDRVEIRYEPIPPRLGAPLGRVSSLRVVDYETEIGHAA